MQKKNGTEKVKSEHLYQVPCVVALPIKQGNQDYLNWLIAETKATDINK